MLTLSDKQTQLRMGQANLKKWVDDLMPLRTADDQLGVDTFATHTSPQDEATQPTTSSKKKKVSAVKLVARPQRGETRSPYEAAILRRAHLPQVPIAASPQQ